MDHDMQPAFDALRSVMGRLDRTLTPEESDKLNTVWAARTVALANESQTDLDHADQTEAAVLEGAAFRLAGECKSLIDGGGDHSPDLLGACEILLDFAEGFTSADERRRFSAILFQK